MLLIPLITVHYTSKLRLGPLPKIKTIKVTSSCTTALKAELNRYAALHTQTYGEPVDAATLIPHMLEAFMARDRGFKRAALLRTDATQRNEKAAHG